MHGEHREENEGVIQRNLHDKYLHKHIRETITRDGSIKKLSEQCTQNYNKMIQQYNSFNYNSTCAAVEMIRLMFLRKSIICKCEQEEDKNILLSTYIR